MTADRPKETTEHTVATSAGETTEAPAQTAIPTATEIKRLKRQADRDKERSASTRGLPVTRARQGVAVSGMRYVLFASLILAILVLGIAYYVAIG